MGSDTAEFVTVQESSVNDFRGLGERPIFPTSRAGIYHGRGWATRCYDVDISVVTSASTLSYQRSNPVGNGHIQPYAAPLNWANT